MHHLSGETERIAHAATQRDRSTDPYGRCGDHTRKTSFPFPQHRTPVHAPAQAQADGSRKRSGQPVGTECHDVREPQNPAA